MKALVIGGGVAGTIAGMALQRAGIEAVVYEAHAGPAADVGSYLGIATNGIDALRAIDAHQPVLAAGFPTTHNVLLGATGRRLGVVTNGGIRPDGTVAHTIKRSRLYRILQREAERRGVKIERGKRLVTAEPSGGDGVAALFEDGSVATGDVLIGCDGVHSVTRRAVDPAAPRPRYVGLVNFGGYTDRAPAGVEPGVWHMVFGKRAFFGYVVDPSGGTVWFANVPRPLVSQGERESTTAEQWQHRLTDLFAGDRSPAAALVSAGRLELLADNTHDLPSVPRWHNGSMVIIGDAAHAPAPTSGQGASMAIEDAVVLALCLRDGPDPATALAAYEQRRRSRVEAIVAHGARGSRDKTPGPVGRLVAGVVLPLVFRYLFTDEKLAWIYDHHIEWDQGGGSL